MSTPITLIPIDRADREPPAAIAVTIDGREVRVPEGSTILSACASIGLTIPTLCYLETLRPVNVCRLCVVEVEGARVLVPSCSRAVEAGMVVHTRSPRVILARRLVLELLASSVDLSTTPGMAALLTEYGCRPERFHQPADLAGATRRGDGGAASEGRQRPLRARLRQVRALLQVRRGVRAGSPEHLRDRRRRTRFRRAHLHRVRRRRCPTRRACIAATASRSVRPAR